jgi:hypothetical protein
MLKAMPGPYAPVRNDADAGTEASSTSSSAPPKTEGKTNDKDAEARRLTWHLARRHVCPTCVATQQLVSNAVPAKMRSNASEKLFKQHLFGN